MDKETLSHYGWIVVLVLILAVLLALASPFGNFLAAGFKATYAGFGMVGDNALGAVGIVIPGQDFENDESGNTPENNVTTSIAGFYKTGTNYTEMIKPWDELISEGIVEVNNGVMNCYAYDIEGDLLLPNDGSVTAIGDGAFSSHDSLTGIMISDTITSIGENAFDSCTSLTSITIPDSVTTIGSYAFTYCENLSNIEIGNHVESMGSSTFFYCTNLTGIEIPASVKNIGVNGLIDACSNLTSIVVHPDNTYYHSTDNCLIETESKKLVSGCKTSVIPSDGSVTTIGSFAFYRHDLTNFNIPEAITTIEARAFSGTAITNLIIPDNVTTLGNYAFAECEQLTSVEIGNGITVVEMSTFEDCKKLVDVTVSNSVKKFAQSVFKGCEKLEAITYNGTISQWENVETRDYWCPNSRINVICTDGETTASMWSDF